jgi:hypothetical protein
MICLPNTQARKRYSRRVVIAMAIYVVLILLCAYLLKHAHPGRAVAVLLAILPALPIIATLIAVGAYLRDEADEFQRFLFQQNLLWGMGVTLAVTSVWGLLELFTSIPHIPIVFTYPAFWFFFGVCTPFLRRQYRSSDSDA